MDRYLRHALSEQEMSEFEAHLNECRDCMSIIKREQLMTAGIRKYGRQELKERLRLRVGESGSGRMPWASAVSAAAVLLIVVGFGVYNRWLLVKETPGLDEAAQPSQRSPEMGKVEGPPIQDRSGAKDARGIQMESAKQRSESRGEMKTDLTQREVPRSIISQQVTSPSQGAQAGAGAASKPGEKTEHLDVSEELEDEKVSSEFWVEGVVLTDSHRDFLGRTPDVRPKTESLMLKRSKLETQASQPPISKESIDLEQRPATELPSDRQALQKLTGARSIQTLVQQKADGMRMILYLDTSFSTADISNANIQRISPDSVVIELPHQRIGYQLPDVGKLDRVKKSLRK